MLDYRIEPNPIFSVCRFFEDRHQFGPFSSLGYEIKKSCDTKSQPFLFYWRARQDSNLRPTDS
jgi:hypothetical protein